MNAPTINPTPGGELPTRSRPARVISHPATTHATVAVVGAAAALLGTTYLGAPQLSPAYEAAIKAAWAKEGGDKHALRDKLVYLYGKTRHEATHDARDLKELYDAFHAYEQALGMEKALPTVRGEITQEFNRRIPERPPAPLTEPVREKISSFMRETIGILERLP